MEEEKSTKKKTSTKKSTTTKKKTTTKPKTTPKKKVEKKVEEVKEEIKEEVKEEVVTPEEKVEEVKVEAEAIAPKEEEKPVTKDKPSIVIYLIVILLTALLVLVVVYAYMQFNTTSKEDAFIALGNDEESILYKEYKVIENEKELNKLFPKKDIVGLDFDKYQYIVLEMNYNPCSESNIKPVDYAIRDGILSVTVSYDASCGGCKPEYTYFLLELPKRLEFKSLQYIDKPTNDPNCNPYVAYKPILYFYPEKETKIDVTLGNPEYLTTTYPKYNNGWTVTAYPDGTLKDKNGRSYYGLFWEGDEHPAKVHEEGFVVKGSDVLTFLEAKLKVLGLTDKEANEFIIYWLPKLENNDYNYIYFETEKEINDYMPVKVNPTPDTMIRIQMDYKALDKPISVKEQKLTTPKRNGFTVVEWGGSIIKD